MDKGKNFKKCKPISHLNEKVVTSRHCLHNVPVVMIHDLLIKYVKQRHQPFNLLVLQNSNSCVDEYGGRRGVEVRPVKWRLRGVKQKKFVFT